MEITDIIGAILLITGLASYGTIKIIESLTIESEKKND